MSQKKQMAGRYYAQKRKLLKKLKSGKAVEMHSKELVIKDPTAFYADRLIKNGFQ
jgi:hypothetical protein